MDEGVGGDVKVVGTISSSRIELNSRSPISSPGSPASSSSSGYTCISESFLKEIKNTIQEGNRAMTAELGNSSRAIRCLEKAIREQTNIMRAMKETLENYVSYVRSYNREERRQAERKKERKKERPKANRGSGKK